MGKAHKNDQVASMGAFECLLEKAGKQKELDQFFGSLKPSL